MQFIGFALNKCTVMYSNVLTVDDVLVADSYSSPISLKWLGVIFYIILEKLFSIPIKFLCKYLHFSPECLNLKLFQVNNSWK